MSPERKFEQRLVQLAKKHGWFCRKVKWIGRNGAPDRKEFSAAGLSTIMASNPPWADGLPLAAAGFETYRYRKD